MTEVIESIQDLRRRLDGAGTVALAATMGALHNGHLSLVHRAAEIADTVVVSIFVNPLQFDVPTDLDRYPRDLSADLDALPDNAIVFAPSAEEMYPNGETGTLVTAGNVGNSFEGASRPGHFDGMLTVVAKLFNIVRPDFAVFGQKDAQQVFLVDRMVRDLDFALAIDVVETVREPDGLAMSSRNRFLSAGERQSALALSRALEAAASAPDLAAAADAGRDLLAADPGVVPDYFAVVDPATFVPIDAGHTGPALAIVAANVGATRLIDNRLLQQG